MGCGPVHTVLPPDVTDPAQIQATVGPALDQADMQVVFNNTGYGLMSPFEGTDDAQLQRQIDLNLLGPLRVTRA